MFAEDVERVYESGPEESDFDVPAGEPDVEAPVRTFKLSRVYF
jgi:hypothetical protein